MRMRKSTAASGFHRFQTGNPRAPRLRKERDKIENEAHSRRRMRPAITKRGRDRIASNRSLTSEMRPHRMHRGEPLHSWHYFCVRLALVVGVLHFSHPLILIINSRPEIIQSHTSPPCHHHHTPNHLAVFMLYPHTFPLQHHTGRTLLYHPATPPTRAPPTRTPQMLLKHPSSTPLEPLKRLPDAPLKKI